MPPKKKKKLKFKTRHSGSQL
uniref:Macaca fascicularis brain cDNA clone: QflA-16045, similar to human FK506 binding protein 14, 22 kDa (FKBP14), mRNA, RefSeq: NM_017946.1 n=1 Tax=Macaca fascicularis TaxID=9541 RepID=I7GAL7_MACFA|nr:unnamed protein product [Macaca fascicularis]